MQTENELLVSYLQKICYLKQNKHLKLQAQDKQLLSNINAMNMLLKKQNEELMGYASYAYYPHLSLTRTKNPT